MNLTNEQRQRLGALIAKKRDLRNELVKVENEIDAEMLQLIGAPFIEGPKAEISSSGTIEQVKNNFPKNLAELLTFEIKENCAIIKPKQFLGSDNFAKIAAIVRNLGGEYVSAGKESHFTIPKK